MTRDHLRLQALLKKVREEGKKVLTLSEQALLRRHGYNIEVEEIRKAWVEEKDSLLAAIQSLKDLLAETHKGRDPSKVRHRGRHRRRGLTLLSHPLPTLRLNYCTRTVLPTGLVTH